jgi:hypothetical protein
VPRGPRISAWDGDSKAVLQQDEIRRHHNPDSIG